MAETKNLYLNSTDVGKALAALVAWCQENRDAARLLSMLIFRASVDPKNSDCQCDGPAAFEGMQQL